MTPPPNLAVRRLPNDPLSVSPATMVGEPSESHRADSRAVYHGITSRSSGHGNEIQHDPQGAGEDDRGPRGRVAAVAGLERDVDPERIQRAAEELTDDGPDDAQRRGDPQRREPVGHGVRTAQLGERLALAGGVRREQLERGRVDVGEAADRVDQDREEDHHRDDRDPRQQALRPEPVERDRGERDDRDRARTDGHRQQQVARGRPAGGGEAADGPQRDPDDEAADRLGTGEEDAPDERRPLRNETAGDDARPRDEERLDAEQEPATTPTRAAPRRTRRAPGASRAPTSGSQDRRRLTPAPRRGSVPRPPRPGRPRPARVWRSASRTRVTSSK